MEFVKRVMICKLYTKYVHYAGDKTKTLVWFKFNTVCIKRFTQKAKRINKL